MTNTVEWGTPVLYMRSSDGVLFRVEARPPAPSRVEQKATTQEEQRPAPSAVTQPSTARAAKLRPDLLVIDTPIRMELICIGRRVPDGVTTSGALTWRSIASASILSPTPSTLLSCRQRTTPPAPLEGRPHPGPEGEPSGGRRVMARQCGLLRLAERDNRP